MTSTIIGITTATELPVGHIFEIAFGPFTPRLTFLSASELQFEIIAGAYLGMKEIVQYQVINLRPGLFVVSWQEKSKTTVVHIEDFTQGKVHAHITSPDGSFSRLTGDIETSI